MAASSGTSSDLDSICDALKIDRSRREKHRAMLGAQLCAQVFRTRVRSADLTGGAAAAFDVTWDQVIVWCRACDELIDIEIADGVAGLVHLRRIFGENFLSFPPRLFGNLLNRAGWVSRWIAWLSDALRCLQQSRGYDLLIRRLVHRENFEEALSVLQTAERLESAGLSVAFDTPLSQE